MTAHTLTGTAPAGAGVISHLRELGGSLCEHIALRIELAGQELSEEKGRLAMLTVVGLLFCVLAVAALVFGGVVALALAWDTPLRVVVAMSVTGVYFAAAAAAGLWFNLQLSRSGTPFAATVAELKRDAAILTKMTT